MAKFRVRERGQGLVPVALLAGLLAGCSTTTTPTPDQMARTTLETAPADLQLMCASAVVTETGAPADKTLPVSSRKLDGQNFQVEVDAAGTMRSCTIDAEGNVSSVLPA